MFLHDFLCSHFKIIFYGFFNIFSQGPSVTVCSEDMEFKEVPILDEVKSLYGDVMRLMEIPSNVYVKGVLTHDNQQIFVSSQQVTSLIFVCFFLNIVLMGNRARQSQMQA